MSRIPQILEALAAGKTVYISTMTRCTKIDPKTAAKWSKAGLELFKATDKNDFMASGRNFVCIDYCSIQISQ